MSEREASYGSGPRAWSILVHGGAGDVAPSRRALHVAGCEKAAREAAEILAAGGSAVDAVERAVLLLEDDPVFNAGTGACLNALGAIELDATIMSGADLRAGGVAALPPFRHPIAIARRVMERTHHVLLAGEAAAEFAVREGFDRAALADLVTEHARARWEAVRTAKKKKTADGSSGGTVGAVARDAAGHVAAATSTGGMVDKMPGRIGDSALIGAGTYADDAAGACSTTGHGEAMIRVAFAASVVDALRGGVPSEAATIAALRRMLERTGGTGGAITIARDGSVGLARTTATMSWAFVGDAPSGWDEASGA